MSTELGNFLCVTYEQECVFVRPCMTAWIVECSVEGVLSLHFHLYVLCGMD